MKELFEDVQGELQRTCQREKMTYLYIPERVAKILKDIDTADINKEAFIELLGGMKEAVEYAEDEIEQATLNLKAKSRAIKDCYKKQVAEELDMLNEFWEELDKQRSDINKKIRNAYTETSKLKQEIADLKHQLSQVSIYGLDSFVELVHKINNMSDSEKELLSKIFDGYKK